MLKNFSLIDLKFNKNPIPFVFYVINAFMFFDAAAWFRIQVLHDTDAQLIGIGWVFCLVVLVADMIGIYLCKQKIKTEPASVYKLKRWLTGITILIASLIVQKTITDLSVSSFLLLAAIYYFLFADFVMLIIDMFLDKNEILSAKIFTASVLVMAVLIVFLFSYLDKMDIEKHIYTVTAVSVESDGNRKITTDDGDLSVNPEFDIKAGDKIRIKTNYYEPQRVCNQRTTVCTLKLSGRLKRYYIWD